MTDTASFLGELEGSPNTLILTKGGNLRFIPHLGLLNNFFLGDNVTLEPVADALVGSVSEAVYIITETPELFEGHPQIVAARGYEAHLPTDLKVLTMDKSLMSWGGKQEAVYKEAGVSLGRKRAPRLYLKAAEEADMLKMRQFFRGPCVGVVLGTGHLVKQWPHIRLLVKELLKRDINVFVFGTKMDLLDRRILRQPVYHMLDMDIRDLMKALRMMDVVVGSDTGPLQIAASLGTKTVVIALPCFTDLYEDFKDCEILLGKGGVFDIIRSVSAQRVVKAVERHLNGQPKPATVRASSRYVFTRIRGLGDVIMSLPAIATLKALDPGAHVTYVTGPGPAKMLEATDLLDEVVAVNYNHPAYGLPLLPIGVVDYTGYDVNCNMMNRVEWIPKSGIAPRTDIFGLLMGLEYVDYQTNWKGTLPEEWEARAREILACSGVVPGDVVIALQLTSRGRSRVWPEPRWREFIGKCRHRAYKVVMLSDERIKKAPPGAINLTGRCSMSEYIGLIAVADLGVGPDSSLQHIAGWLDRPAIGLFGSIDPRLRIAHYSSVEAIVGPGRCVPCNDWQLVSCDGKADMLRCMWGITANKIFRAVERKLRELGVVPKKRRRRASRL